MKTKKKTTTIPTLRFNSDYFKCPRCGWQYPGPMLVNGDVAANTPCQSCGHSYLVRVK